MDESEKVKPAKQEKKERQECLDKRVDTYEPTWGEDDTIVYKTEYIAILSRNWSKQVQFIIAFDDLTKEGYQLMAIDQYNGNHQYYYFQNIKCV